MAKSNSSAAAKKQRTGNTGGKTKYNSSKPRSSAPMKPGGKAAENISAFRGQKFSLLFCFAAFLIPFLLTLIAYAGFDVYPFGKRSVLTLDLNGQYIYYFEGIRNAFRGDGSIFYNWSRNLSGGFMGIIGYYLASPFTLIPILMPREYILEAIMLMQMCKVGACGFTFCIYAQKSKKLPGGPAMIFSIMYAMMAFVVIQLIDPMWIDGPILLPLVILGIEHLIDDGRKLGYIIPTALVFIANFYMGFMIAIFIAIYFTYYLFFGAERKFKNIKDYAKTVGVMAGSTVVVLMLSAIMILPVYNALKLGKFDFTDPVYDWHQHLFKLPELIPTLLPNQYYSVNVDTGTKLYGRPEIYCGVLTVVLAPLYFFNKNIKWNKKLGYGLLVFAMVMSMYVKPLNMYWHGGQDPNWLPYRYSFLLSFILVSMAAEVFANLDGLRLNRDSILNDFGKHASPVVYGGGVFSVIAILILSFMAVSSKYDYTSEELKGYKYPAKGLYYKAKMNFGSDYWTEIWLGTLGFGLLLAGIYTILVFVYSSTKKKNLRTVLLVVTACLVSFEGGYNCYDSFRKIYKEVGNSCRASYADIISAPDDIVAKLEDYDGSFYRAEKTYNRMVNDDMAYGLRGITHSSSVMNTKALQAIDNLGYFTQSFESKYEGCNPVADSILGIKYVINSPERASKEKRLLDATYRKVLENIEYDRYDDPNRQIVTDKVDIYENPNALSIGFMADKSILDMELMDDKDPFKNLNDMLAKMTGNSGKEYYTAIPYEVQFDENQVNYHDYKHTNGVMHDCWESYPTSTDAVVNVRLTVPEDGDVYMHLTSQLKKTCNVWVGIKNAEGKYTGTSSDNYDSAGKYFDTNSSPIVRLGPFTKGQEIEVRFTIPPTDGKYTGKNEYLMVRKDAGFQFCNLDTEEFVKDINTLKSGQWEIDMDKTNDRHLEGTVNVKPGQVFVTSIPYEPGWTVKIDGKKVKNLVKYEGEGKEQHLVNKDGTEGQIAITDAFIGIRMDDISAGEHTITMTYTPPGFTTGVVTLILGIIACVFIFIYDRRHNEVVKAKIAAKKAKSSGTTVDETSTKVTEETKEAPETAEKSEEEAKAKSEISDIVDEVLGEAQAKRQNPNNNSGSQKKKKK